MLFVMSKWKYTYLILSALALAIGFSGLRENIWIYLGYPIGSISFGLFLIAQVLEKELALYDKQTHASQLALTPGASRQQPELTRREVAHDPALTMASPR
jgi:hypothetical protein